MLPILNKTGFFQTFIIRGSKTLSRDHHARNHPSSATILAAAAAACDKVNARPYARSHNLDSHITAFNS